MDLNIDLVEQENKISEKVPLNNHCEVNLESNNKPVRTQDLLFYAFQVSRGMQYLVQRKV